jgi:hypothetical protein
MRVYPYNNEIKACWKSYPVRIQGNRICHSLPTVLVESMGGGFVTQNCIKCNSKYTLSFEEFKNLEIFVSCPECKEYMSSDIVNKNYSFVCKKCDLSIPLASILPKWDGLTK